MKALSVLNLLMSGERRKGKGPMRMSVGKELMETLSGED